LRPSDAVIPADVMIVMDMPGPPTPVIPAKAGIQRLPLVTSPACHAPFATTGDIEAPGINILFRHTTRFRAPLLVNPGRWRMLHPGIESRRRSWPSPGSGLHAHSPDRHGASTPPCPGWRPRNQCATRCAAGRTRHSL